MRLFLRRFSARHLPGGLLLALLCTAMAGPEYFRGEAATLIVNSTADSGAGSLRAAIAAATDGDTIHFDAALNGQTPSGGPVTHFAVSAPGIVTQYFPFNVTVSARDQFNNTVVSYTGTVHFTSTSSGNGTHLPADSTLTNGTGIFSVMLGTPGNQTVTATDTINASITGTSNPILVGAKGSPSPSPPPTATATATPTATPCPGTIFWSENFDGLPPGIPGPCWTISTVNPDTPPNDAFCSDPPGIDDCVFDFNGITIPSASAVLRFRNNFNLEFSEGVYWDGGVLEVSSPNISGGAFLDITDSHVGGSFISGGYTGEIDGSASNPLAGRLAWGGDSGGYLDTVINLGPNLVGQTVMLRFRFGSDGSGGAPGWRVDTMTITDGVCVTPTPTPNPTPSIEPPTHFAVSAPASVGQGSAFSFTVTALDRFNNTVPDYAGMVHFTSTDSTAELPVDSTLLGGTGTFSAALHMVGQQTITGTDPSNALTGTSNPIFVVPKGSQSPTPTPAPSPTPAPLPPRLLNTSTRLRVETGDNVMIGGFIITGTQPKSIAARGLGPSLVQAGITDALADPTLELHVSNGGITLVQSNDDWQDNPVQAAQLIALGLALPDPKESGLVATLDPAYSFTTILAGKNGGTGVGLIEIYDTDAGADSQLGNISTRGFVRTGNNVMIGGFILGGSQNSDVVVRGIGPTLAQSGLSPVLVDPTLELRNSNGMLLVANDNWQDDPISAAQLTAHGLAPSNPNESGIFASIPPGTFTAILAGKNGGTGIGLVEIYDVN